MRIKTSKFRLTRLMSLILVTAFLAMQWTPAHIHLNEQHDHEGSHHQHLAETHVHNLTKQISSTDFDLQASHADAIVLAYECCFRQQDKQKNISAAFITEAATILQPVLVENDSIPATTNFKLNYLGLSTANPRAPPQIS